MKIRSKELTKSAAYKLLTGVVVPRPIAWVSTMSKQGRSNLAPFSCFTFVSTDPPMIAFNCGLRDGRRKDTAVNILETSEFVVNIVDDSLLDPMHRSAADYPDDVDEIELLELPSVSSDLIAPRRIASSPISMECVLDQAVKFGRAGSEFFVGEIQMFHVRDGLFKDGKIDSEYLRPLARLAGPVYGKLGEIVRVQRSEVVALTPVR
jgi:flavin reductase (DIM6/NTAB) family NADH-FMN oxidoreductase RutF